MAPPTVLDLITVLQTCFFGDLDMRRALYVIAILPTLYPLLRLHQNQTNQPRQPEATGWLKLVWYMLYAAFHPEERDPDAWDGTGPGRQAVERLWTHIDNICDYLGVQGDMDMFAPPQPIFPQVPVILSTERKNCIVCPPNDGPATLRKKVASQTVRLIGNNYESTSAYLVIAHCHNCDSNYYPDRYTYKSDSGRLQKLELDASFLRVSKHGIWVVRSLAISQEKAVYRLHAGFFNFAEWVNDSNGLDGGDESKILTVRQSQKMFTEHMARRLIKANDAEANFECPAEPNAESLARAVINIAGVNGGLVAGSMDHQCRECTHKKRYHSDLENDGVNLSGENLEATVAGTDVDDASESVPQLGDNGLESTVQSPPNGQQIAPPAGEPRGYVQMATMDGKTITHRKCALDDCRGELTNYRDGRFCADHIGWKNLCGIVPCGRPVEQPGALTCDLQSHKAFYNKWVRRFARESYAGVRRVIRRQQEDGERRRGNSNNITVSRPELHTELPSVNNVAGAEVTHTFRAGTIYCVQTIQWACGTPIGWGKCYKAESAPQVLAIIDNIWQQHPNSRPAFISYDDACNLFRHIITQNQESPWLAATRFIVDAWHYVGHRATDALCRTWCNPAPANGTQPDLVIAREDEQGRKHLTRAFNTETAEQLNAWLNGFEASMRQMTAVNFDFFMHSIMLIYKDAMENRIQKKGLQVRDASDGSQGSDDADMEQIA